MYFIFKMYINWPSIAPEANQTTVVPDSNSTVLQDNPGTFAIDFTEKQNNLP